MTTYGLAGGKHPDHIFIVDDKKSNLKYLEQLLEYHGFTVSVESDPCVVLTRLKKEHPHLILLDVLMPELDGFSLCGQLKEAPHTAHIPIIFMTGLQDDESKVKGFNLGAVDYILKPFQEQEIIARIRTHLTLSHLRQQLQSKNVELQKVNHNLSRAMRHRDEFLANISHELRTPLNAILNMAESLHESVLGELNRKQQQAVGTIVDSGQHLLSLVNDVLDLSRIATQKLTLEFEQVSIEDLCLSSIQKVYKLAITKNITIHYETDIQSLILYTDSLRLKQILLNLLSNAIKFSPPYSTVALQVNGDEEEEWITFSVQDEGMGIVNELLPKIFRPFVQLDSGLTKAHGGTGLGLTLVNHLVDMHGGSIRVESQPNQGACFSVRLPWLQQESFNYDTFSAHLYAHYPHKTKILIADDSAITIDLLSRYLIPCGYQLIVAYNGHEVLEKLNQETVDLVFMDVQMPIMTGLEVLQQLRMKISHQQLRIVMMSALFLPSEEKRCIAAGAAGYLLKPINQRQLFQCIQAVFD